MKFLIGLIIGLALGYAAASMLAKQMDEEEVDWAATGATGSG